MVGVPVGDLTGEKPVDQPASPKYRSRRSSDRSFVAWKIRSTTRSAA